MKELYLDDYSYEERMNELQEYDHYVMGELWNELHNDEGFEDEQCIRF